MQDMGVCMYVYVCFSIVFVTLWFQVSKIILSILLEIAALVTGPLFSAANSE